MRCTNCGGNANHCKCPMVYERPSVVFVGPPTECAVDLELEPVLPQAVTAEPEQRATAIEAAADELDREFKSPSWKVMGYQFFESTIRKHVRPVLDAQHEVIEGLIRDRDGARRALAGNIEVTERQLKEQYTTIERLSALYRAVCDLPTGGNDDGTMEIKCSVLRRIAVVFDSLRDLKISYLQPGTEAAPNGPR